MRPPTPARLLLALLALLGSVAVAARATESPAAALTSGGWTTTVAASPTTVEGGGRVSLSVRVTSATTRRGLVDVEVYSPSRGRLHQQVWDDQAFTRGRTRTFTSRWTVPAGSPAEQLVVKVGVFAPRWSGLQHWNDAAATFRVRSGATTTTAPATTTTTRPTTTTTAPATTTTTRPTTTTTAPPATTTTTRPTTTTTVAPPAGGLPPRPAGWPSVLHLGVADDPGGAAALRASVPVGFRYQYLAGGVNTGAGWAGWNTGGDFARYYIEDSRAAGTIPVFTYYQLYQSSPGASMGESAGVAANLGNTSTMTAYYGDLRLFFQKAGAAGGTTVLHVEPDLWGFLQQRSAGGDAATVPAKVAATGLPELAGLPDDARGFAQAIVRLRDRYAPNVVLGYHYSTWGTGNDFLYSDPSDSVVDSLGTATARFYQSLGARFDVAFTDIADRDAEFKRVHYGDGGASWLDARDYARSARYIAAFGRTAGLRSVLWQIPFGNTKMAAVDNSWNHYQDNKVEVLLDDPARATLRAYADAGVIAFLFGRGADGATCACDANRDGVTNPAPVNGNTRPSLNADDDGGFFRDRAGAYYRSGAVPLG